MHGRKCTLRPFGRVVWIIVIILVLLPFGYVQYNKMAYAQRVSDYLLEQKHHKQSEILSVTGVWNGKLPPFSADVVFADEPEVVYIYFAHNDVIQFGYRLTEEGKKKGIEKKDLRHFVQLPE